MMNRQPALTFGVLFPLLFTIGNLTNCCAQDYKFSLSYYDQTPLGMFHHTVSSQPDSKHPKLISLAKRIPEKQKALVEEVEQILIDYGICCLLKNHPNATTYTHPEMEIEVPIPDSYLSGKRKPRWVGSYTFKLVQFMEDGRDSQYKWVFQQIDKLPRGLKTVILSDYLKTYIKYYGFKNVCNNGMFARILDIKPQQQRKIFDTYNSETARHLHRTTKRKHDCYRKLFATFSARQKSIITRLTNKNLEAVVDELSLTSIRQCYEDLSGQVDGASIMFLGTIVPNKRKITKLEEFREAVVRSDLKTRVFYWAIEDRIPKTKKSRQKNSIKPTNPWAKSNTLLNGLQIDSIIKDFQASNSVGSRKKMR